MPNCGIADQRALLRRRVGRFFSDHSKWKTALRDTMSRIRREGWPAVVFGGVPRDLLVFGLSDRPRDVDIVVDDVSLDEISKAFAKNIYRKTRFGGLSLHVDGWLIDVWPLRDTWAFREGGIPVDGFQDLPKTTFLNVEAVAVDLTARVGSARNVYSSGFFEAVEQKTIEVNFEPNPFPGLCIVRSIIMAMRLGFRIGPRLATYISRHSRGIRFQELIDLQMSHYGSVRYDAPTLWKWISQIDRSVEERPSKAVSLRIPHDQQLVLWQYWSPTL